MCEETSLDNHNDTGNHKEIQLFVLRYVVSRVCIACTVITVSSVSICLFNNKKREKNEIQCKVFSVHGSSGLTVLIPV